MRADGRLVKASMARSFTLFHSHKLQLDDEEWMFILVQQLESPFIWMPSRVEMRGE